MTCEGCQNETDCRSTCTNVAIVQRDEISSLSSALRALLALEYRHKNPYGHDCEWCGDCRARAWADAIRAIDEVDGI